MNCCTQAKTKEASLDGPTEGQVPEDDPLFSLAHGERLEGTPKRTGEALQALSKATSKAYERVSAICKDAKKLLDRYTRQRGEGAARAEWERYNENAPYLPAVLDRAKGNHVSRPLQQLGKDLRAAVTFLEAHAKEAGTKEGEELRMHLRRVNSDIWLVFYSHLMELWLSERPAAQGAEANIHNERMRHLWHEISKNSHRCSLIRFADGFRQCALLLSFLGFLFGGEGVIV